jgi:hypothetical protein
MKTVKTKNIKTSKLTISSNFRVLVWIFHFSDVLATPLRPNDSQVRLLGYYFDRGSSTSYYETVWFWI